jgi:hypothetical protein
MVQGGCVRGSADGAACHAVLSSGSIPLLAEQAALPLADSDFGLPGNIRQHLA